MTAPTQAPEKLVRVEFYREPECGDRDARIKIFSRENHSLSMLLPPFAAFGLEVVDERINVVDTNPDAEREIDLGVRLPTPWTWDALFADRTDRQECFVEAVQAVWTAQIESDSLNSLVLTAGLPWRKVVWLRAIAAYLRQTQAAFSLPYICEVVAAHPRLASLAVQIFEERFDPHRRHGVACSQRQTAQAQLAERFVKQLDTVASLDEERILRSMLNIIEATVRTSAYQNDNDGGSRQRLSFKVEPTLLSFAPHPAPTAEIWVYSPAVEGVHMRFGKVARGGIRWSDRREDFRTEVLALTKAQVAKNSVIVPTGAKGAYLPKRSVDPTDREAWQREGLSAYREFIAGLLDLTDNRAADGIVSPPNVVRHDDDDPYLVVAADKGTATFSDEANAIARTYGFWLGDAFASGGSQAYDHKAIGITARGAWVSVERHLREVGINTCTDDFTVIGIGDMSGDVFGNGLLISEHARLVAAFDHRHIFLDPDPDPAVSIAERRRLAALPRSSWADYDPTLISDGGMVVNRTGKSVTVSEPVAAVLGLDTHARTMTPNELIRAILASPVDLLWNGGIGTYVKASGETHAQAGDRTNDAVRIDANTLRVKAVGEGGNLGLTQAARVQAARSGVRLNTDAVDNAAGVDTSDHEVNIKIALAYGDEELKRQEVERTALLDSMTDDVAHAVLNHNYDQNVLLAMEAHRAVENLPVHRRLIRALADSGHLDLAGSVMPDESELAAREADGQGLVGPELAILMASSKNALKDTLTRTSFADDPWFGAALHGYFPPRLQTTLPAAIAAHPLRREIVINSTVNDVVNRAGITAVYRAAEETGAPVSLVVKAYVAAIEVFGHRDLTATLKAADNGEASTLLLASVRNESQRLLDRGARWFLNRHASGLLLGPIIADTKGKIAELLPHEPDRLWGEEAHRFRRNVSAFEAMGATSELARVAAGYLDSYVLLDVIEIADQQQVPAGEVAGLYHYVSDQFRVDYLLTRVSLLPRHGHWDRLSRTAQREDLYAVLSALTRKVAATHPTIRDDGPTAVFEQWRADTTHLSARTQKTIADVCLDQRPTLAAISVAVRSLRALTQAA